MFIPYAKLQISIFLLMTTSRVPFVRKRMSGIAGGGTRRRVDVTRLGRLSSSTSLPVSLLSFTLASTAPKSAEHYIRVSSSMVVTRRAPAAPAAARTGSTQSQRIAKARATAAEVEAEPSSSVDDTNDRTDARQDLVRNYSTPEPAR